MENLLAVSSRVLIWIITLSIPVFGWFLKRMIKQIDDRFEKLVKDDEAIKAELDEVKIKVNDACKHQEEIKKIWEWITDHQKWSMMQNEKNHLVLQELSINVKRICDKLEINYLKQNGN